MNLTNSDDPEPVLGRRRMDLEFWTTTPIRCPKPPVNRRKKTVSARCWTAQKPCKWAGFGVHLSTPENRGVLGSIPSLAIQKALRMGMLCMFGRKWLICAVSKRGALSTGLDRRTELHGEPRIKGRNRDVLKTSSGRFERPRMSAPASAPAGAGRSPRREAPGRTVAVASATRHGAGLSTPTGLIHEYMIAD